MLALNNKIQLEAIRYKSEPDAITDLLSGRVQLMNGTATSLATHVKAGKLRPLAVATPKRSSALPDVPTIAEAALPGFEVTTWFGALAPAKTPKELVVKLNAEMVKILNMPDVRKRLLEAGAEPVGNTPDEMAAQIKKETEEFAKIVKQAKIVAE